MKGLAGAAEAGVAAFVGSEAGFGLEVTSVLCSAFFAAFSAFFFSFSRARLDIFGASPSAGTSAPPFGGSDTAAAMVV